VPRARGLVALAHSSCSLHAQSDADFSPHTLELHTENTALYWLTPESSDEILMKQAPPTHRLQQLETSNNTSIAEHGSIVN